MRRIGIIGTENSHVDHFIRLFNREQRYPGNTVVALSGGQSERNLKLQADGGIDLIVERPEDLIGKVDAAITCGRDGRLHREQSVPLLAAGIPMYVDKPLAASVDDAQAIIEAARRGKAPLASGSPLRYVPEIQTLRDNQDGHGPIRHLTVTGPADPDSEYSGLFFYGIHHVEAALQLLGNPVVEPGSPTVHVSRQDDTTVALVRLETVTLTFAFVRPGQDGNRVPFHAVLTGTRGVQASPLTLGPEYSVPVAENFLEVWERGTPPAAPEQLVSPVALMESIVRQGSRR
ncbi:MAG TPA: Gfo/Idh/MocA family oxidoreductase [Candidatus Limnocylindrales bacterium]